MKLTNKSPEGEQIYTLAQSGTPSKAKNGSIAIIKGEGTQIENNKSLPQRAKRKTISRSMILSLVDIAKNENDEEWAQRYWNTYHCQNKIVEVDGKLHGEYCKNRFCTVCLAIRKAEMINKYLPELSTWEEPHLVTLTMIAVKARLLKKRIEDTKRAFTIIHNRLKTRHKRGKCIRVKGIKSLECNFNAEKKTYNPHFHLIVPDRETADLILSEWLKLWTRKYASPKAQDISKVYGLESALIETIKYGSKIFTEPDIKSKKGTHIYAKALHTIFKAMKGKRLFDRFGFNSSPQPTRENSTRLAINGIKWTFEKNATDWINPETGEYLTGYEPSFELEFMLNERINVDLN